ncbi:hypothetical protein V1478_012966 [Vespula squamosa]|uniref:Uncharacterized protein n=1 Tax=Vespula squamosa TaxID=30214 RepID=A0ABD2A9F9_VESSQ
MSYFNSEIHSVYNTVRSAISRFLDNMEIFDQYNNDCTNQHIHSVIIAFFSYVDTDQNRSVHKSIIIYYDERLRCNAIACISRRYQNFFENDRRLNYRTINSKNKERTTSLSHVISYECSFVFRPTKIMGTQSDIHNDPFIMILWNIKILKEETSFLVAINGAKAIEDRYTPDVSLKEEKYTYALVNGGKEVAQALRLGAG